LCVKIKRTNECISLPTHTDGMFDLQIHQLIVHLRTDDHFLSLSLSDMLLSHAFMYFLSFTRTQPWGVLYFSACVILINVYCIEDVPMK